MVSLRKKLHLLITWNKLPLNKYLLSLTHQNGGNYISIVYDLALGGIGISVQVYMKVRIKIRFSWC